MSVRVGRVGGGPLRQGAARSGSGSAPGAARRLPQRLVYGRGPTPASPPAGGLFIGDVTVGPRGQVDLDRESVDLRPHGRQRSVRVTLTLGARGGSGKRLGRGHRGRPAAGRAATGTSPSSPTSAAPGRPARRPRQQEPRPRRRRPSGSPTGASRRARSRRIDDRAFGPILFSQYTLSRGVLKMTAQMPPVGREGRADRPARGPQGRCLGERSPRPPIHPRPAPPRSASTVGRRRRTSPTALAYTLHDCGEPQDRRALLDRHHPPRPGRQAVITVARRLVQHPRRVPQRDCVARMASSTPTCWRSSATSSTSHAAATACSRPSGDRRCSTILRKWYLHGWTWRELTRDRPSVSIPDDHDVYQGNIWGEGGRRAEHGRRRRRGATRCRRVGQRRASDPDVAPPRPVRPDARASRGSASITAR